MLFKQLLFAASAAAFLVIPETSENDDNAFSTLPIDVEDAKAREIPTTAFSQSLDVPCTQCRGHDTHLKLDFAVEGNNRLLLNGFELYPNADPWQGDLTAAVVKGDGNTKDRRLGYGLAVRPEGTDEDQKLEVIALELLIIEVGDRFVEGVPSVKVKLVKSINGDILIGNIDMTGSQTAPVQCSTMLCRVESAIDHAWTGIKGGFKGMGCKGMHHHGHHGHKGQHGQGHHSGKENGFSQYGHHGYHGYHGHHGKFEHKHHHTWSVVKHIASYVLLPVIMGITAGIGVAVLTMFLGTLVMRLVRFFRGEPEEAPLYVDHKVSIIEFLAADDEKARLMEHEQPIPRYQDEDEADRV